MISLSVLKDDLNITGTAQDNKLIRLRNRAVSIIEDYCKRRFLLDIYEDEIYRGTNTRYINLKNYPIIEVEKVEENVGLVEIPAWVDITSQIYVKEATGQIFRSGGFFQDENDYRISYSAGFDLTDSGSGDMIPESLQSAVVTLVSFLLNSKSGEMMKSESLGEASYTRFERSGDLIKDLGLRSVLFKYRTPTIGGI